MLRWEKLIILILFAVYFINGIIAIPKLSITFDEGDNLSYAIRMVKGHSEKVRPFDDASTMPMLAFNALPRAFQQLQNPELKKSDGGESDIIAARYITLLLSSLIGFYILRWSSELYGKFAGLLSLSLFVFCPNLNANVWLVTSDALSALFTISTAYYFWRWANDKSWKNIILFSLSIAVAQLAKQSLTHLLIIFPLLLLIWSIRKRQRPVITRKSILTFSVFCLIFLFVINAGFLFRGTGQSLSQFHFTSRVFQKLQTTFSFFNNVPLPLPEPYISGLDLTMRIDEIGPGAPESSGPVNILGESRVKKGFWYYYFVSLFFKTPVPVIFLSILLFIFCMRTRQIKWYDEFIPFFCIAYFLVYFNFFYNSQVGIRHVIMIYPLLYVLLGKTAAWLQRRRIVAALVLAYSIITFYVFYPNLYAYSNEFIPDKKNAYRILGDANIDYSQGYFLLHKYFKKHPDVHFPGEHPAAGKYVTSAGYYVDSNYPHTYDWIRKFKPVNQVEYCFLLFDISEEDLKKAGY